MAWPKHHVFKTSQIDGVLSAVPVAKQNQLPGYLKAVWLKIFGLVSWV